MSRCQVYSAKITVNIMSSSVVADPTAVVFEPRWTSQRSDANPLIEVIALIAVPRVVKSNRLFFYRLFCSLRQCRRTPVRNFKWKQSLLSRHTTPKTQCWGDSRSVWVFRCLCFQQPQRYWKPINLFSRFRTSLVFRNMIGSHVLKRL